MMKFVPLAIEELAGFELAAICGEEVTWGFSLIVILEKPDSSFYVCSEIVICPDGDCNVFVVFLWPRKYE
jgi:hypothetical protein